MCVSKVHIRYFNKNQKLTSFGRRAELGRHCKQIPNWAAAAQVHRCNRDTATDDWILPVQPTLTPSAARKVLRSCVEMQVSEVK